MRANLKDVGKKCPVCGKVLHVGTIKKDNEEEGVEYCKSCGFREERY